jgi:hypothetical protein
LIRASLINLKLYKVSLDGDEKFFCCGEEKKPDKPDPENTKEKQCPGS